MEYIMISRLHVVFAGMWLINFLSDSILRRYVVSNKNKIGEKKFIHLYLTFANLFGMIGAIGILLTGITAVILSGSYGFFQMNANHWLTTKQILMVALLIVLGAFVIPTAKKVRQAIGKDLENKDSVNEDGYKNLQKLFKLNTVINVIVLINFLLAITHRWFS